MVYASRKAHLPVICVSRPANDHIATSTGYDIRPNFLLLLPLCTRPTSSSSSSPRPCTCPRERPPKPDPRRAQQHRLASQRIHLLILHTPKRPRAQPGTNDDRYGYPPVCVGPLGELGYVLEREAEDVPWTVTATAGGEVGGG